MKKTECKHEYHVEGVYEGSQYTNVVAILVCDECGDRKWDEMFEIGEA